MLELDRNDLHHDLCKDQEMRMRSRSTYRHVRITVIIRPSILFYRIYSMSLSADQLYLPTIQTT